MEDGIDPDALQSQVCEEGVQRQRAALLDRLLQMARETVPPSPPRPSSVRTLGSSRLAQADPRLIFQDWVTRMRPALQLEFGEDTVAAAEPFSHELLINFSGDQREAAARRREGAPDPDERAQAEPERKARLLAAQEAWESEKRRSRGHMRSRSEPIAMLLNRVPIVPTGAGPTPGGGEQRGTATPPVDDQQREAVLLSAQSAWEAEKKRRRAADMMATHGARYVAPPWPPG